MTSSCDNLAPPVRLCTHIFWHNYTAVIELASNYNPDTQFAHKRPKHAVYAPSNNYIYMACIDCAEYLHLWLYITRVLPIASCDTHGMYWLSSDVGPEGCKQICCVLVWSCFSHTVPVPNCYANIWWPVPCIWQILAYYLRGQNASKGCGRIPMLCWALCSLLALFEHLQQLIKSSQHVYTLHSRYSTYMAGYGYGRGIDRGVLGGRGLSTPSLPEIAQELYMVIWLSSSAELAAAQHLFSSGCCYMLL